MHILAGHDGVVSEWIGKKLGGLFIPPVIALGIIDQNGTLRGGFVIRPQNKDTCELSVYSEGVLTNGVMRTLFRIMFEGLSFTRCVINTPKNNKAIKRAAPKMGFKFECAARNFYGSDADGLQFSMTPDTCRWLTGKSHV